MSQLLSQQIGVTVFMSIMILVAVSNLVLFRGIRRLDLCETPLVSVLVPARNEIDNIRGCLESLLTQDYPDYELIVLDDGSKDGTSEELEIMRGEYRLLSVMKGRPLPDGWLGKNWACYQLAGAARGDLLLFTDADTRHEPGAVSRGVSEMLGGKLDFLTAFPRQEMRTTAEKLTIPILGFSMLFFFPLLLAYRWRVRSLAAAIGQFMLFKRDVYESIGGHEAVRDQVLDDFEMAKMVKAGGYSWRFMWAGDVVKCRMYRDIHEVFGGIGKNIFSVFGRHLAAYTFIWLWMLIAFVEPIVLLVLAAVGVIDSLTLTVLAAVNVSLALALWALASWRFEFPSYLVPAYPAIVSMSVILAFHSMYVSIAGRTEWKGRTLQKQKFHWL